MKRNWARAIFLAAVLGASVWSANLFAGASVQCDGARTTEVRGRIPASRVNATTLIPIAIFGVALALVLRRNR